MDALLDISAIAEIERQYQAAKDASRLVREWDPLGSSAMQNIAAISAAYRQNQNVLKAEKIASQYAAQGDIANLAACTEQLAIRQAYLSEQTAALNAFRELERLNEVRAIMQADALARARTEIGEQYLQEIERWSQFSSALGRQYHEALAQKQLQDRFPDWYAEFDQLQRWRAGASSLLPTRNLRADANLEWLWVKPKISSADREHKRLVRASVTALLNARTSCHGKPVWDRLKHFLIDAILMRVVIRQLRTLRARAQSFHSALLRHFILGTRFAASVRPTLG